MYGSSFNFDQLFLRVWAHCGNLQLFPWFKDSRLDASSKFFQVICIALSNLNMASIAKWKWVLANIFISFPTFSGSNRNHTGHLQWENFLAKHIVFLAYVANKAKDKPHQNPTLSIISQLVCVILVSLASHISLYGLLKWKDDFSYLKSSSSIWTQRYYKYSYLVLISILCKLQNLVPFSII